MYKRTYKKFYNDFKFMVFENAKETLSVYEVSYMECGQLSIETQCAKRAYIRWLSVIEKMGWADEWYPIEAEVIEGVQETYEED